MTETEHAAILDELLGFIVKIRKISEKNGPNDPKRETLENLILQLGETYVWFEGEDLDLDDE